MGSGREFLNVNVNMCRSIHFIKLLIVMKEDERRIMLMFETTRSTVIKKSMRVGCRTGRMDWKGLQPLVYFLSLFVYLLLGFFFVIVIVWAVNYK